MSADAKVWCTDEDGVVWHGVHDGECTSAVPHDKTLLPLAETVKAIEVCMGKEQGMRWLVRAYPGGQFGLVGYV